MKKFIIGNVRLSYWPTFLDSERFIEIPLGVWFKQKHPDFIEIGAVLPSVGIVGHPCYDLMEVKEGVVNVDAETLDLNGKSVLCISTIEHFGRAEYGSNIIDEPKAARFLQRLIKEPSHYLVTFPAGVHDELEQVACSLANCIVVHRVNIQNEWAVTRKKISQFKYGTPFGLGNAIAVITNDEDLLS